MTSGMILTLLFGTNLVFIESYCAFLFKVSIKPFVTVTIGKISFRWLEILQTQYPREYFVLCVSRL